MVGFKKIKEKRATNAARSHLTPEAETLDEGLVAILVIGPEVLQQTTTTTDQLEETTTAVVVLLVLLEMVGEVVDPLAEQRNLNLRRASVVLGQSERFSHIGDGFGLGS